MYRIFIVEDDAVIASAVEGHLRSWGWDARCAGDFGNIDLDVLTAKIQAMLRRTYDFAGQSRLLEHRGAVLNVDDGTLNAGNGRIDLTRNEHRILQVLLENKGRIVSRDTLMLRLWESDSYVDDNTLTVNMTRLRKKLEENGLTDFITTKKGSGYLIAD